MALLHDSVDFKKLDVRLIERNIARGVLTPDELNKAVTKLPDDSANAEWINVDSLMETAGDSLGDDSEMTSASHSH